MEFLSFVIQIVFMLLLIVSQIFVLVLKLVPVGFFFWLIKQLFVGGEDIVTILLTGQGISLLMITFIIIMWYIILIGILHLIININIFGHFQKEILKRDNINWGKQQLGKQFQLNKAMVMQFANEFMSAVKHLKGVDSEGKAQFSKSWNSSDSILRSTEMVKNNALLSIVLFQGWLLNWSTAFHKLLEKFWKWTNLIFILLLVWVGMFVLNLKQEYTLQTWETVMVSNGYEYLKQSIDHSFLSNVSPRVSSWITWLKGMMNESLSFRDEKIKMMARLYYNSFWMKYLTRTELVEAESSYNPISLAIDSSDAENPEKSSKVLWEWRNNFNTILSLEQKKLIPDSLTSWWAITIYSDEMAKLFWVANESFSKYPEAWTIKNCIATVNASTAKEGFFTPRNIFNSTLYQNESGGEKYNIDVFSGIDKYLKANKKNNKLVEIRVSAIDRLVNKIDAVVPWTTNNKDKAIIWLYFILWKNKDWSKYIIDSSLYNEFKQNFKANQIKWSDWKITNIKMVKNYNSLITDFCYGFATFKKLNTALTVWSWLGNQKKHSSEFNIDVPFVDYEKFFDELFARYQKIVNEWQLKKLSEVEKIELAYYLFTSMDIRLRTWFSQAEVKSADALKDFFYMFWDTKDMNFDYMNGSLFIKQGLDGESWLQFFLERFKSYHQEAKNVELSSMMQAKSVQDIFWKYIWLDSWLKNFYYAMLDTIKTKYKVMPWWMVFNADSLAKIKNRFFRGYRWEGNTGLMFWEWVLWNAKIQNLIYSLQNEIKVANGLSISSNLPGNDDKKTILFFGESYAKVFDGSDWLTYKKNWIMIWIIPIIESDIPFLNNLLFLLYIVAYFGMLIFVIWFSGIWQIIYNYIIAKKNKWAKDIEFKWKDQIRDFLIRFLIFIVFMRVYFIVTTF